MLISVVIPLYNKREKIASTIKSVLDQSYQDFEVIVVDDGSTDNSVEVVKRFDDLRIHLVSKINGGPSSARNEGVRQAHGDWVYFIDADDKMEKDTLEHFAGLVDENPQINVFVANYYMRKGSLFKKHSLYIKKGICTNNFRSWFWETLSPCQGAVLYKKNVLLLHPYPENLKRWEDAAMFFEVMRHEKIYLSKKPVFTYELEYSCLSRGLDDITKDYLGYLDISGKHFWERMCFYVLYKQAIAFYPQEAKEIYGENFFCPTDIIAYWILYRIKRAMRALAKLQNIITSSCSHNE